MGPVTGAPPVQNWLPVTGPNSAAPAVRAVSDDTGAKAPIVSAVVHISDAGRALAKMAEFEDKRGDANKLANSMQSGLLRIIKQYPPYQAEDKERIDLMMHIVGIRKELAAMGYPISNTVAKLNDKSDTRDVVAAMASLADNPAS